MSILSSLVRSKKGAPSEESIFQCIGMLAQSVGQALTKHMHELLDLMFAYGLSPALEIALTQLGKDIPPLLPEIQGTLSSLFQSKRKLTSLILSTERVLNLISQILAGEPFVQAGAPHRYHRSHHAPLPEQQDQIQVILALEVLGSFNFKGIFQINRAATPCQSFSSLSIASSVYLLLVVDSRYLR